MNGLREVLAEAAADIKQQLSSVFSAAQPYVLSQVHEELPVAIEHMLRAHAETGVLSQATELHMVVEEIQKRFSEFLIVPDNQAEVLANAELWLWVDDGISYDDFIAWFLEVFRKKLMGAQDEDDLSKGK